MLVVLEFLVEFLQIFFTDALNICIQCQHQAVRGKVIGGDPLLKFSHFAGDRL